MSIYDLAVAGGGPAGFTAALAAARNGARVVLVERYGFVGGCMCMPMPILGMASSEGEKLVGGLAAEFLDRLRGLGGCAEIILHPTLQSFCPTNGDMVKIVADRMLAEAGVTSMLHAPVTGANVADGRIQKIMVGCKEGPVEIPARFFIDATGDADLAALAGAPTTIGREGDQLVQSVTVQFTIGGVDIAKTQAYLAGHPAQSVYPLGDVADMHLFMGFQSFIAEARKIGILTSYPRDYLIFHLMMEQDRVGVNTTKINCLALTSAALGAAEIEGRRQAAEIMQVFRRFIPGFERAVFQSFPAQVGVRETRRILGRSSLGLEDVRSGRRFPDGIALSRYPVDIHDPGKAGPVLELLKKPYHIPFGCLIPREIDNLLAAGRCISASHEAIASARVMGTCMAMGQAAGTAAALCVRENIPPSDLDAEYLRTTLREQGALL
jgi:hypothetical protein